MTNVLPLVISSVTAYYSYKLGKAKLDRETAKDNFERLNAEIEKMKNERDASHDRAQKQDQQIVELKKELLLHDSEKQQRGAENGS
ncbi:hypothetical protein ACXO4Q_02370 [Lactobacillus delbrueckii subsp. bulgaricus]